MDGNIISQDELKNLHKLLKEAMAEEILENYDFSILKNKALNLIKVYEQGSVMLEQVNQALIKLKQADVNSTSSDTKNEKKSLKQQRLQCLKDIYKAAFDFDDEFSKFLYGDKFPKSGYYIYEDKNTHTLTTYPMSLQDMAERIYTEDGKTARINLRKGPLDKFLKATNQQSLEDSRQDETWQGKLQKARAAFKGSQNRLGVYYANLESVKNKNKKEGEEKTKLQKQGGYLLWKQKNEWKWIQVTNAGDLKEGYVQMLYEEHIEKIKEILNTPLGVEPYYSHKLIGLYVEYVQTVTNTPAILEEDVVTLAGQFGIKTAKAEMPKINQYVFAAQTVVNSFSQGKINKEYIASLIAEKYNQHAERNIEKKVQGEAEEALNKTIEELQNSLK